jgi:hypothetical protein
VSDNPLIPPYPGVVDYSDDPILPPWYVPGWTSQNEANVVAPVSPFILTALPTSLTQINVTGNWADGSGNALGGYLTFEVSNDLLVTDVVNSNTYYYTIPAGLVGDIPANIVGDLTAWNQQGSGKIHLIYGQLSVILYATDNEQMVPQPTPVDEYAITGEQPIPVASWVYHVKEYWKGGRNYDIIVPSENTPVDINTLIVPGTVYLNTDWARGF